MNTIGYVKGYLTSCKNNKVAGCFLEFLNDKYRCKAVEGLSLEKIYRRLECDGEDSLYAMLRSVEENYQEKFDYLVGIHKQESYLAGRARMFLSESDKWISGHENYYKMVPGFYKDVYSMVKGTGLREEKSLKEIISFERMNRSGGVPERGVPVVMTKKKKKNPSDIKDGIKTVAKTD
jgi:hypothetical protein